MSLGLSIDKLKVGFHRFKKFGDRYLLTNDIGDFCFIDQFQYEIFLKGDAEFIEPAKYEELVTKGFIRNNMDFDGLAGRYALKNSFLSSGTSLHIIVVTLRCDHGCVYCQAGSEGVGSKNLDMDKNTAKDTVDRIFEFPSKNITIEFQGGEPLLNFDTVRFIIKYALKKNKTAKKTLMFSLVTNLTFMTEERLNFFIKNNIGICTSLDGPAKLHDHHRSGFSKNTSHKNTTNWIKKIKDKTKKTKGYRFKVSALTTITKCSLSAPRQIIDEFIRLGLDEIHLRPINPFGSSKKIWQKLSFSAEEFIDFYKRSLDYIIELNLKGIKFSERTTKIFLFKILTEKDPNFLDTRTPCGAGIGQLAYNFDGSVYCCDEARMLSRMKDESFRLGSVKNTCTPESLLNNDVIRTVATASYLNNLPGCSDCVYQPYCGVCPIYNYSRTGDLFSSFKNDKCRINMAILDYLFEKMQDSSVRENLENWVNTKSEEGPACQK